MQIKIPCNLTRSHAESGGEQGMLGVIRGSNGVVGEDFFYGEVEDRVFALD